MYLFSVTKIFNECNDFKGTLSNFFQLDILFHSVSDDYIRVNESSLSWNSNKNALAGSEIGALNQLLTTVALQQTVRTLS